MYKEVLSLQKRSCFQRELVHKSWATMSSMTNLKDYPTCVPVRFGIRFHIFNFTDSRWLSFRLTTEHLLFLPGHSNFLAAFYREFYGMSLETRGHVTDEFSLPENCKSRVIKQFYWWFKGPLLWIGKVKAYCTSFFFKSNKIIVFFFLVRLFFSICYYRYTSVALNAYMPMKVIALKLSSNGCIWCLFEKSIGSWAEAQLQFDKTFSF